MSHVGEPLMNSPCYRVKPATNSLGDFDPASITGPDLGCASQGSLAWDTTIAANLSGRSCLRGKHRDVSRVDARSYEVSGLVMPGRRHAHQDAKKTPKCPLWMSTISASHPVRMIFACGALRDHSRQSLNLARAEHGRTAETDNFQA